MPTLGQTGTAFQEDALQADAFQITSYTVPLTSAPPTNFGEKRTFWRKVRARGILNKGQSD